MYSISGYGKMIADRGRMDAYVKALRAAVKPDLVVLDIGTGTGIFALLACQFGARKVYALEYSDAIDVGKEIAIANGYKDRIEFIHQISTQVQLPELADVIISDLRGILPLFQHHIPSIIDARERLLAPGGILIPQRDTLWAAVVTAPELYARIVKVWENNPYQLNMNPARKVVTNTWIKSLVNESQLLTTPECWGVLDYFTVKDINIKAELNWVASRREIAHGLSVWFDATLAEGIGFSNAPGMPELIYSQGFFPWLNPVLLETGDEIWVTLRANLIGDEYIWSWDTRILDGKNPQKIKAKFKQSTFWGMPLSPAQLHKTSANYIPTLSEDGEIDRLILDLMNNGISLGDIARQISSKFPARFPKWEDALTRVGAISKKYT